MIARNIGEPEWMLCYDVTPTCNVSDSDALVPMACTSNHHSFPSNQHSDSCWWRIRCALGVRINNPDRLSKMTAVSICGFLWNASRDTGILPLITIYAEIIRRYYALRPSAIQKQSENVIWQRMLIYPHCHDCNYVRCKCSTATLNPSQEFPSLPCRCQPSFQPWPACVPVAVYWGQCGK